MGSLSTCSAPVRHVSARDAHPVRLACIRHAASVDPEPGSNSPPVSLRCIVFIQRGTPPPGRVCNPYPHARQPPRSAHARPHRRSRRQGRFCSVFRTPPRPLSTASTPAPPPPQATPSRAPLSNVPRPQTKPHRKGGVEGPAPQLIAGPRCLVPQRRDATPPKYGRSLRATSAVPDSLPASNNTRQAPKSPAIRHRDLLAQCSIIGNARPSIMARLRDIAASSM